MKFKFIGIVFFALISIIGCKEDDTNEIPEFVAQVIEVNAADTIGINEILRVEIVIGTPTPCYEFTRYEVIDEVDSKAITTYAKGTLKAGEACITTVGRIGANVNVSFAKAGNQFIIFNPNVAGQIIDTVFVKN